MDFYLQKSLYWLMSYKPPTISKVKSIILWNQGKRVTSFDQQQPVPTNQRQPDLSSPKKI